MDMNIFLFIFTCTLSCFVCVYGDYDCLCNYSVEKTVFSKPETNSKVIGYMYEFDCKPIYKQLPADSIFLSIQYEHQIGYVESDGNLMIQSCQGTIPKEDALITTSPPTLPSLLTTTPKPVTSSKSSSPNVVTSSYNNSMPATVMVLLPNGTYVQTNEHSTPNPSTTTTTPTTTTSTTTTPTTTTSTTPIPTTTTSTTTTPTTTTTTSTTTTPTTTTSTTTTPTTTTSTTTTPTTTTSTTTTPTTTTSTTTTPTTTTSTTVPPPSCPNGWLMYRESCYKFRTQHRVEWSQADEDCRSSSSHLAIIETEDENIFIKQQLDNRINTRFSLEGWCCYCTEIIADGKCYADHGHAPDTAAWVGGSDHDNEGVWEWFNVLTNTRTQMTYTHWRPGQPDAGEHDHDEDCLCMVGNKGFDWEDYSCRENMYFVCEKSALHTPSTTKPATPNSGSIGAHTGTSCRHGWTFHDGSCYFFHTNSRWEWPDADAYCTKHQSHLAIIETAAENNFLIQILRQRIDYDDHDHSDTGTWLSGTDKVHEGTWMWKDGNQYKHIQYNNWSPGEPDHGDNEHEEDCMAMIGNEHFEWHDYACHENMFFVCEQPAGASFGGSVIIG